MHNKDHSTSSFLNLPQPSIRINNCEATEKNLLYDMNNENFHLIVLLLYFMHVFAAF